MRINKYLGSSQNQTYQLLLDLKIASARQYDHPRADICAIKLLGFSSALNCLFLTQILLQVLLALRVVNKVQLQRSTS